MKLKSPRNKIIATASLIKMFQGNIQMIVTYPLDLFSPCLHLTRAKPRRSPMPWWCPIWVKQYCMSLDWVIWHPTISIHKPFGRLLPWLNFCLQCKQSIVIFSVFQVLHVCPRLVRTKYHYRAIMGHQSTMFDISVDFNNFVRCLHSGSENLLYAFFNNGSRKWENCSLVYVYLQKAALFLQPTMHKTAPFLQPIIELLFIRILYFYTASRDICSTLLRLTVYQLHTPETAGEKFFSANQQMLMLFYIKNTEHPDTSMLPKCNCPVII